MDMKEIVERTTPKKPRGRPKKVTAMGRKILPPPPPPEKDYKLKLTIGKEVYESEGVTIVEALENLPTPGKIFIKGFVSLTHGERHTERLFMPVQLKRFLYPVARSYVAKALAATLK